jgi:integrase
VRGIQPMHVLKLRDAYAATPAAANNLLRCLSSMMGWSVPRGWRTDNPCREVKPLKGGEGYAPWAWDVIEQAKTELRPDLWWAVALALYTGQRMGDVLAMRWDAINGGMIAVRQEKTGKRLAIPLHKDLRAIIETIPRRAVTVLTSTERRPWTKDGFKATWNKHKPAGAAGLVFHGLRKSAVVTLLECGCTDAEVAAITGQSREMVEHYAKQVNQAKLAASAILRWEQGR